MRKAPTNVEKAICADPDLGYRDKQVASEYHKMSSREATKAQISFLKQRNFSCENSESEIGNCLREVYSRRLEYLQSSSDNAGEKPKPLVQDTPKNWTPDQEREYQELMQFKE